MTIPHTIPWERDIHTRISVSRADGYTWVDLLPFASSVEVASGNVTRFGGRIAGIDGVMPQLDLVLRQDPDNKLNPQDQNSAWNIVSGQYNPLLAPMREIIILTATTLPGVTPTNHDWIGLFHGYLGDGIRVEGDVVRVNCRSLSKRLQETYIEDPKDYGSEDGTPLEHVIQDVLDDNGLSDVELYCPEPTGFMVETYSAENVQYKTVWDVLQALATAHDFFLGDIWDPNTERMRLTLLVPPRDKDINTADFVLNYRSDFLREEREIRDTAVRNVIIGHYWDKGVNEKRTITVKDDTSIGEFGRRAMEVSEDATSLIQTEAEMLTFLHAILSDLKDQQGTSYLQMPFFPQIGLFSGLVIHHPAMSSTDDFMGVESYRHSLDFEGREYRTEIVGSGRIRGGQQRWLKSETKPGSPSQPSTPPTSNVPPADVAWGHCSFVTDVSLAWEPVRGATAYEIRTDDNWGYSDGIIYRGNSLNHRFVPVQRNYTFYIKALDRSGNYSNQATPITLSLPAPAAPDQPVIETYFNAIKIWPMSLNLPSVLGYYIYVTKGDVTNKIPIIAGGDYTYPASSGTTVTIQVSAYDVLGEGPKSEPLQATTTHLADGDIPKDIIDESMLTKNLRSEIQLTDTTAVEAKDLAKVLQKSSALVAPKGALLARFERDFITTDNEEPVVSQLAEIVPEAGRYSGAVLISPNGSLAYEADVNDAYTVVVSRASATLSDLERLSLQDLSTVILFELAAYKHYAIRSDGTVFVEGEETPETTLPWLTIGNGRVTLLPGLYDQLLAVSTEVDAQTIASWALTKNPLLGYGELDELNVRVNAAEKEIGSARSRLETAEDKLDSAQGEINSARSRLETAEDGIVQLGDELSAKVSQTVFDILEGRVEGTEGSLTVMATEIAGKVSQTTFEFLEGRVTDNEATLTAHATQIQAKVTQDVHDTLAGRVEEAEGELTVLATEIAAKVSRSVYDTLENRVTNSEASITANTEAIALKAERSETYTKTEVDAELGTKVDTTTYTNKVGELEASIDGVTARVEGTEIQVSGLEDEIDTVKSDVASVDIKADGIRNTVSSLEMQVGGIDDDVTSLQGQVNILPGLIEQKADTTVVDAQGTRITTVEQDLSALDGVVATKATAAEVTAQGARLTTAEQEINALDGAVTTTVARVDDVEGEVLEQAGQIQLLSDRITLKIQRRDSDGKLIVTGIGIEDDEVAVLADRFRILGDVEGESQAVFAVDTQTQKIYIMGDLIAEGLMRATEVQAELIKTLLLQAELGIFDELRGLLMRADKLTVGGGSPGFISSKPENSHLWHFDNSLQSTQGLAPASGSATLAPDGGKFGGGVVVQSSLRYDTGVGNKNTVVVYRGTAKLSDYAGMTLAEM